MGNTYNSLITESACGPPAVYRRDASSTGGGRSEISGQSRCSNSIGYPIYLRLFTDNVSTELNGAKMMKIAGATALTLGTAAAKEIPAALKEEFMMPTRDGVSNIT